MQNPIKSDADRNQQSAKDSERGVGLDGTEHNQQNASH
jgi:hypothetical protein